LGRTFLSLFAGAVLEILTFLSLIPDNSTKLPNPWQAALGHTLSPAVSIVRVLNPTPDNPLPQFLTIRALLVFGLAFLAQAAVFGLPVWVVAYFVARARTGRPGPLG
jgi:hypothetical protein